jgi:hypothetical protein
MKPDTPPRLTAESFTRRAMAMRRQLEREVAARKAAARAEKRARREAEHREHAS